MLLETPDYRKLFDSQITGSFRSLLDILRRYPASLSALIGVLAHQKRAEQRRNQLWAAGTPVPPLLIVSTTDACNLNCAGCYAHALRRDPSPALPEERIHTLMQEAEDLGVSAVLLAGGEPLLQTAWLDALAEHPLLAGLVFTNGTLIDDSWLDWFDRHRQIVPVISLEGDAAATDRRRGEGVHAVIREKLALLNGRRIPFGLSITVNRTNLAQVSSEAWVHEYADAGCRLFLYVEYVPAASGTEDLVLTSSEKSALLAWLKAVEATCPAFFMIFPGDEDPYGGCLASARGFVHISTSGDLEPCPFAPFSDCSLTVCSLSDGLHSRFLSALREQHQELQESKGGCALWQNRDWVAKILKEGRGD
ncbi:MAG: radical SAM protein [Clostridiaceae bacterium]|nr:radical SAM protein [Clostridiaceae bacterium]